MQEGLLMLLGHRQVGGGQQRRQPLVARPESPARGGTLLLHQQKCADVRRSSRFDVRSMADVKPAIPRELEAAYRIIPIESRKSVQRKCHSFTETK